MAGTTQPHKKLNTNKISRRPTATLPGFCCVFSVGNFVSGLMTAVGNGINN